MQSRPFGNTGLSVSIVGFGAGHIGDPAQSEDAVGSLLNGAVDLGVTLIDTARGYGLSEERIGRHLAHRRPQIVLSSKGGYGVEGHADWTPGCIRAGVEQALRTMRTDYLDIMHLHSCPRHVLEHHGVAEALHEMVQAGKVRVAAYSGENADLEFAISLGLFGSIQTSVNVCDQRGLTTLIPQAAERGMGVIGKRAIANAFWRFEHRPEHDYCLPYWDRARLMGLRPGDLSWAEFALRFSAWAPGVSSVIVGTSRLENLRANVEMAARGPLPADQAESAMALFRAYGRDWPGQV